MASIELLYLLLYFLIKKSIATNYTFIISRNAFFLILPIAYYQPGLFGNNAGFISVSSPGIGHR